MTSAGQQQRVTARWVAGVVAAFVAAMVMLIGIGGTASAESLTCPSGAAVSAFAAAGQADDLAHEGDRPTQAALAAACRDARQADAAGDARVVSAGHGRG